MSSRRLCLLTLLLAAFVVAVARVPAEEAGKEAEAAAEEAEKEWLEFYYENPSPDRFVPQMKDWAKDGTLDNDLAKPALVAFLSQVIRQNHERLEGWYADLAGLDPGQLQTLHTAMLYSRTKEADAILRERYGKTYDEQKLETEKILEMPLDRIDTIDMLWGFFYATGSEGAVRRIVTAFRFRDAPEKPSGVEVPEGYLPLYKELPRMAYGSLVANGERHPKLAGILKGILESDQTLLEVEKEGVYDVLSQLDAKAYPPKA